MVILVEKSAARGPRSDITYSVDGLPKVGEVRDAEHAAILDGGCLAEPTSVLLIGPLRVVDGVAALYGSAGSIEPRELRVRNDGVFVEQE
jgi:hypothetical protein